MDAEKLSAIRSVLSSTRSKLASLSGLVGESLPTMSMTLMSVGTALEAVDGGSVGAEQHVQGLVIVIKKSLSEIHDSLEYLSSPSCEDVPKYVRKINKREIRLQEACEVLQAGYENAVEGGKRPPGRILRNEEDISFWEANFPQQYAVMWDAFSIAVEHSFSEAIPGDEAMQSLSQRLDEKKDGFVTVYDLARVCKTNGLRSVLQGDEAAAAPPLPVEDHESELPLVVWVDDKPTNNERVVNFCRSHGIHVHTCVSTAEGRNFMRDHKWLMSIGPTRFRLITDNSRHEQYGPKSEMVHNMRAGEDIVRFLRGRRCKVPVMVYCWNVDAARETAGAYEGVRVTRDERECMDFVRELL